MDVPETDFPIGRMETGNTEETSTPCNGEFLRTLFGMATIDHRPVIVSFAGHPSEVSKSAWFGQAWLDGDAELAMGANNYFSLAVFRPNDAGKYRRMKTQFATLHAVMLDDLGGKVAMDRLSLPPTWLLETSPGNHQAGYLLKEPLTDGPLADRLMNAIVATP